MNEDPRSIIKQEALYKGDEYRQIVLEAASKGGFQVSLLEGRGTKHTSKSRKTFATKEEAEQAAQVHKLKALDDGFKFKLDDWQK